jgi:P27 family predicted phage terminase small subunit
MGGRGSGGRNKKTVAQRKAEGNRGRRKISAREPKVPEGDPKPPARLSARARHHWKRLLPLLRTMGVLKVTVGDALAGYCTALVQWELAQAAIQKFGIHPAQVDEETGAALLKMNPAVRVQSDALRHIRAFQVEFGLTPASISRITLPKSPDDSAQDPLENIRRAKTASDVVQ